MTWHPNFTHETQYDRSHGSFEKNTWMCPNMPCPLWRSMKYFFYQNNFSAFWGPKSQVFDIRSGCDFSDPAGLVAQVPVKLRIAGGQTGHEGLVQFCMGRVRSSNSLSSKESVHYIIRQGCVPANIKSGVAPSLLCHWTRFDSGGDHIALSSWGGTSAKRFKIRSLDIEFRNSCRLAVNRGVSDFFVATWCWDNKGNNNSLGS